MTKPPVAGGDGGARTASTISRFRAPPRRTRADHGGSHRCCDAATAWPRRRPGILLAMQYSVANDRTATELVAERVCRQDRGHCQSLPVTPFRGGFTRTLGAAGTATGNDLAEIHARRMPFVRAMRAGSASARFPIPHPIDLGATVSPPSPSGA